MPGIPDIQQLTNTTVLVHAFQQMLFSFLADLQEINYGSANSDSVFTAIGAMANGRPLGKTV